MLNLLPEDMRAFHRKRTLNSAAFVWGVVALVLLGIGLLTLVPAYSYTLVRSKKDPEQIKGERKTHELAEQMQTELENDAVTGRYIGAFYKAKQFTSLYTAFAAVAARHPSVTTDDMTFARGEKANTLTVRGRTQLREDLVAFVRDLESDATFQSVSLPIGDLAGREGVFLFTLTLQTAL